MKKEVLITKWLDNEQLTKHESEAFNQLDDSDSYMKISKYAKNFSATDFDVEQNRRTLLEKIENSKKTAPKKSYLGTLMRIAAIFVIGIGLYFSFFKEYDTTIHTIASEKSIHELPDKSVIRLNALSSITYDKENWDKERKVTLKGEAYFKVAKGKKFDVHTPRGIVSVIGTRFNIKQRDDFFEVICYQGVVSVSSNGETKYLRAGDAIELVSGKIKQRKTSDKEAKWYNNKSYFYQTPFTRVLKELEWQYGVSVTTKNIDPSVIFTGNFVHSDIQTALKSITIPMRLKYTIDNKKITLFKE